MLQNNLNLFINDPDIIVLTETWLTKDILNSELNLKNYNIYREDRKETNNNVRGGWSSHSS